MREASIRFRVATAEKSRIENFARGNQLTVSDLLRCAAADVVRGEIAGEKLRRVCVDIRCSANRLLHVLNTPPIDVSILQQETANIREVAERLIQLR